MASAACYTTAEAERWGLSSAGEGQSKVVVVGLESDQAAVKVAALPPPPPRPRRRIRARAAATDATAAAATTTSTCGVAGGSSGEVVVVATAISDLAAGAELMFFELPRELWMGAEAEDGDEGDGGVGYLQPSVGGIAAALRGVEVAAQREFATEAGRHLGRALERRPDATALAACLAQLMAFIGKFDATGRLLANIAAQAPRELGAAELRLSWLQRNQASCVQPHSPNVQNPLVLCPRPAVEDGRAQCGGSNSPRA